MWSIWLHDNTNINIDLRQIECYFIRPSPHEIITLNIVVGLDEYLLIMSKLISKLNNLEIRVTVYKMSWQKCMSFRNALI